jgi:hypothetical protein
VVCELTGKGKYKSRGGLERRERAKSGCGPWRPISGKTLEEAEKTSKALLEVRGSSGLGLSHQSLKSGMATQGFEVRVILCPTFVPESVDHRLLQAIDRRVWLPL